MYKQYITLRKQKEDDFNSSQGSGSKEEIMEVKIKHLLEQLEENTKQNKKNNFNVIIEDADEELDKSKNSNHTFTCQSADSNK